VTGLIIRKRFRSAVTSYARAIHLTHTTRAECGQNFVRAQAIADGETHIDGKLLIIDGQVLKIARVTVMPVFCVARGEFVPTCSVD
jgi:hypothetical protein